MFDKMFNKRNTFSRVSQRLGTTFNLSIKISKKYQRLLVTKNILICTEYVEHG